MFPMSVTKVIGHWAGYTEGTHWSVRRPSNLLLLAAAVMTNGCGPCSSDRWYASAGGVGGNVIKAAATIKTLSRGPEKLKFCRHQKSHLPCDMCVRLQGSFNTAKSVPQRPTLENVDETINRVETEGQIFAAIPVWYQHFSRPGPKCFVCMCVDVKGLTSRFMTFLCSNCLIFGANWHSVRTDCLCLRT